MKKAGVTIFLLCMVLMTHAAEKLFLLVEDGFHEFLKNDFHRLALSLSRKYDCKLAAVPEKGVAPVLKISKQKESENYNSVLFAVRGYLLFANAGNPVGNLSRAEFKQLMEGTLIRWSKPALKIRQICYYGSEKTVPPLNKDSVPWVRFSEPPLTLQMVSLDSTAIGILPLTEAVLKVKGTKPLTVDGIAATPQTVMDGTYPASERYYLSIRKDAPLEVWNLYNKLRSKQTKLKLIKAGILPAIKGD